MRCLFVKVCENNNTFNVENFREVIENNFLNKIFSCQNQTNGWCKFLIPPFTIICSRDGRTMYPFIFPGP